MDTVIVDARKWQSLFDLRTGKKIDGDTRISTMVRSILARRHYPGDLDQAANRWVTDTALDLVAAYTPRLVCLSYAQQYFEQRITPLDESRVQELIEDVFSEAERFVASSGFVPVIVGTGDMMEVVGEMDLSMLDGIVFNGTGSGRYTGLCRPSRRDLDYISSLPGVERLVDRNRWLQLFPGTDYDQTCIPDWMLVCKEGWSVRSVGSSPRKTERVQKRNPAIPVATTLGTVSSLPDIRHLIAAHLPNTPVALIVIEGVGMRHFPRPFMECDNSIGWYCYEPGEGQYLTMTTGEHQVFAYPPGYRFSHEVMGQREFPFSGHFMEIPRHTLGMDFDGRSIAVGNRSMFTHMVFGADISVECFARNLFNQGCIAVLKEKKSGIVDESYPETMNSYT